MLPPVAEIYVVWHPGDQDGMRVAQGIVDHFHGTPFTGLIGGAVEVYVRSVGWRDPHDAPRPIPLPSRPPPNGLAEAELTAVVPVLGSEFASVCEGGAGPWHQYVCDIAAGREDSPQRVGIFPVMLDHADVPHTRIGRLLGRFQGVGTPSVPIDVKHVCRDLSQGIAQLAGTGTDRRLTVFISHARSDEGSEGMERTGLISKVRAAIGATRLREFFDAHDLQPGDDWSHTLSANATISAMLVLRTDHYASRSWCQREILTAKCAGMPVVILDALDNGDDRGSFLMDHVPRVPVRGSDNASISRDIDNCLNRLVDECLKRALWQRQRSLAQGRSDLAVSWWAPHAPEPATLAAWLSSGPRPAQPVLRVLHPDPPLGPEEVKVLTQMVSVAGATAPLEVLTPRTFAARGG